MIKSPWIDKTSFKIQINCVINVCQHGANLVAHCQLGATVNIVCNIYSILLSIILSIYLDISIVYTHVVFINYHLLFFCTEYIIICITSRLFVQMLQCCVSKIPTHFIWEYRFFLWYCSFEACSLESWNVAYMFLVLLFFCNHCHVI